MRKLKFKWRMNAKGLSLVEVLASIVILTIVLISFSNLFLQSAKHTKFNKEKLTAVQVAEDVVAKIRIGEYSDEIVGSDFPVSGYPGYKVTIKIESGPSGVNLNKAVITVSSNSETGIKKSSFKTEMYFEYNEVEQ